MWPQALKEEMWLQVLGG